MSVLPLRHLETFLAVAESLCVACAAEQVQLPPSGVIAQIQALEIGLDAVLFDRTQHRLRLSEPGRRLLGYARDLVPLVDDAGTSCPEIAPQDSGAPVIGALHALCGTGIPRLFTAFGQAPGGWIPPGRDHACRVAQRDGA